MILPKSSGAGLYPRGSGHDPLCAVASVGRVPVGAEKP
jgi:hypothetical protein